MTPWKQVQHEQNVTTLKLLAKTCISMNPVHHQLLSYSINGSGENPKPVTPKRLLFFLASFTLRVPSFQVLNLHTWPNREVLLSVIGTTGAHTGAYVMTDQVVTSPGKHGCKRTEADSFVNSLCCGLWNRVGCTQLVTPFLPCAHVMRPFSHGHRILEAKHSALGSVLRDSNGNVYCAYRAVWLLKLLLS